jgi:hypothetical protein
MAIELALHPADEAVERRPIGARHRGGGIMPARSFSTTFSAISA